MWVRGPQDKTKIDDAERTREACSINMSLSALGNVISSLTSRTPTYVKCVTCQPTAAARHVT